MIKYAVLASLALTVATPAFAKESYSETVKVKETDASGTTSSIDQTITRKTHADGTTDATIKTKEVSDPKGLFNKSEVKTEEKVTSDKDGNITKDKVTVNGKVVDDANGKVVTETK